jgi:hypothetical protein
MNISSILSMNHIFTLFLFYLLGIIVVWAGKNHILPVLRQQVKNIEKAWKQIEEKLSLVSGTKKRIVRETKQQDEKLDQIKSKLTLWKEALLVKQKDREDQQITIDSQLFKKKQHQGDFVQLSQLQKNVLPKVLIDIQENFVSSYEKDKGHKLTKSLIKSLR